MVIKPQLLTTTLTRVSTSRTFELACSKSLHSRFLQIKERDGSFRFKKCKGSKYEGSKKGGASRGCKTSDFQGFDLQDFARGENHNPKLALTPPSFPSII
jgi:hypothetical protein